MSAFPAPITPQDQPVTDHGQHQRPATSCRPQRRPATSRWHNHLPGWILDDPAYQGLRTQFKHTLQAIANKCGAHNEDDGSLLPCFGGAELIAQAGCSRSKFWTHLKRLEKFGFVVTINRGGQIGCRNVGNIYGVPGKKGALDARACPREMRVMRRGKDGTFRAVTIMPGAQATIFEHLRAPVRTESGTTPRPKVGRPPSQSGTTPRPKMGRPVVPKWDTIESTTESGSESYFEQSHDHDHGFLRERPGGQKPTGRTRLRRIHLDDLTDTAKLLELFEDSVARHLIENSQDGMLRFVAAAEHALRCAETCPVRLFASIVNRDKWYLSQEDEKNAAARLDRHFGIKDDPRDRQISDTRQGGPHRPTAIPQPVPNTPDGDAHLMASILVPFRDQSRSMPHWDDALRMRLEQQTRSVWNQSRYEAARAAALNLMGVGDPQ